MLRKLKMELETEDLDYRKSSNLQGVLFEQISPEYAEKLHLQQRHPYSQYVENEDGKIFWYVNTLDEEADKEILQPLTKDTFQQFEIKKQSKLIKIKSKTIKEINQKELVREFYEQKPEHYFNVSVLTPTAFKQRGKYVIYPDLRLIYQSLMHRYSAVLTDIDMMDEDTLEMMAEGSEIVKYKLRSVLFPLEGITIPAFIGTFSIKVTGTDTMAGFIRMLLKFGEYSGIGIKTALGMGAVKLLEGGKRNER